MTSPSLALSNLKTFVIIIVLAAHSVLAYLAWLPPSAFEFDSPPYRWRTIPIVGSERWLGFDLFCAHPDVYLNTLLFFLSGLFIWPSLKRKGAYLFVQDRLWRIGLPFALAVAFLMPVASYPIYRATAVDPSIIAFWQHWMALPFWHGGPAWFLWVLLVFDLASAAMFALARHWGDALARWSVRPRPYLVGLMLASALAYVPLAIAFTPWEWGQVGPFALQLSRPLHYAVYFFAGVGIGAGGIERGLLAADGLLARRWPPGLLPPRSFSGSGSASPRLQCQATAKPRWVSQSSRPCASCSRAARAACSSWRCSCASATSASPCWSRSGTMPMACIWSIMSS